ncbi:MAG: hypothetical protein ACR2RE_02975 [Geminicoccaceae bacterium]
MANEISRNSRKNRTFAGASAPMETSSIVQLSRLESQDNTSAVQELESRLLVKDRRIDQLQGERTQLTRLLNESQETIQSLNRKIGHYEAQSRTKGLALVRSRLLAGYKRLAGQVPIVRRVFGRLPWIDGPEPVGMGLANKPSDSKFPPLVPQEKTGSRKPMLAVAVLGMSGDDIEAAMPIIDKTCKKQKLSPLLLVDNDDFGRLRKSGIIFEYLPPEEDRERFGPSLNWDLYFQRRLADIRRKWNPVKVISFGRVSSDLIELWSKSVFEQTPIPATVDARLSAA